MMTALRFTVRALTIAGAMLLSACAGMRIGSPMPASGPPATFTPTTSDSRATRVITVRDGLTRSAVFRAASELLSQRYSVDVSDSRAGFLMTPWQATSTRDGAPDLRYRTRVVVRFLGDDFKQASVRVDANWQRGDEWDVGFDVKMLDDVAAELTARVGKK